MTREKVKELLPVLEAYANGKTIQYCNPEYHWEDVKPNEQLDFGGDVINYRIKSEPKYRPFKNEKECFEEMKKHYPIGWMYCDNIWDNILVHITETGVGYVEFDSCIYSFVEAFNNGFTFVDGQPFGVKE